LYVAVQFIKKGGGFRPYEALATPYEAWTPRMDGATSCPAFAGIDERRGVNLSRFQSNLFRPSFQEEVSMG